MLKRLFSGILIVALLLTIFPSAVMAEGEEAEPEIVMLPEAEESPAEAAEAPAEESPEESPVEEPVTIPEESPAESEQPELPVQEPEMPTEIPAEEPVEESPVEDSAAEVPAAEEIAEKEEKNEPASPDGAKPSCSSSPDSVKDERTTVEAETVDSSVSAKGPYQRSSEVPLALFYDFSDESDQICDMFTTLLRELAYMLEQTRQSVLPLQSTEVAYEAGEAAFMKSMAGVAAAFAVRNGWERPDQEPMDQQSRSRLRRVFWDMVCIYPVLDETGIDSGERDENGNPVLIEERKLSFHISVKSAEQIGWQYGFTQEQRELAMELEKDESVLKLCFPQPRTEELLAELGVTLPADLMPLRRKVVESALSLVGRIGYFWGGKPGVIGWDQRWGAPTVVRSDEGETISAWGLDCSGFVGWAFGTATNDMEAANALGMGTSTQWGNTVEVEDFALQSGDLVWLAMGSAETTHVGIVVGRDRDGRVVVCHCNAEGVTVSALEECGSLRSPAELYRSYGASVAPANVKTAPATGDTRSMKGARIG